MPIGKPLPAWDSTMAQTGRVSPGRERGQQILASKAAGLGFVGGDVTFGGVTVTRRRYGEVEILQLLNTVTISLLQQHWKVFWGLGFLFGAALGTTFFRKRGSPSCAPVYPSASF